MQLIEVNSSTTGRDFIQVNVDLNRDNPNYIRPLDKDVNEVFDPSVNKSFRSGQCTRWILKDDEGNLIGRIAAFINKKYRNKGDEFSAGGIGFFDCINDQVAANILFDAAKTWLRQRGMEAMDGPVNFGERDKWWGLVTKGFQPPLYCMNYNPPYYQQLFETYGFHSFFNQVCFGLNPKQKLNHRLFARHAHYANSPDFKAVHIDKDRLPQFAEDFATVYNKAWAGHGGLKELRKEQVLLMFNKMKPIMDEKLIWFCYHFQDPIAMFINLPDLNQWFKHLHGKFDWLHKLQFWLLKKIMPCKRFTGLVFGVIPEFHGKGIDAFLIAESAKVIQHTPYTEYEMQWIGDFNPKMMNVAKHLGDTFISRILTTYRYLFDPTKEFKPHPVIG